MTTWKRKRGSCRLTPLFAIGLSSAMALSFANACSRDGSSDTTQLRVAETGGLQLALTATGPDDVTYQLRNAVFAISGRNDGFSTRVSTEVDPGRRSLLVELPPDTYDVLLEPGFALTIVEEARFATNRQSDAPLKVPLSGARRSVAADAGAPPPAGAVEAELVSDNPATAVIRSEAVTPLTFAFRVAGEVIGELPGVLDLGISVHADGGPPPPSCSDDFEPNDSPADAAPIPVGVTLSATLCDADRDYYAFEPAVPVGAGFSVELAFAQAQGDVDAFLFDADGELVASGESVTDDETLFGQADGRAFTLEARLFSASGRVAYSLRVGGSEDAPDNGCCEPSEAPGCSEPPVLACTCAIDPFCCEEAFDQACVELASDCGAGCEPTEPSAPCCTPSGIGGCADEDIEQCTCEIDPFCCEEAFDESCVDLAESECGAVCLL